MLESYLNEHHLTSYMPSDADAITSGGDDGAYGVSSYIVVGMVIAALFFWLFRRK